MNAVQQEKAEAVTSPIHFPNSDLIEEPIDELRKVREAVSLVAHLGSADQQVYDQGVFFGFCELIESQLSRIHQDLEAAMATLDLASKAARAQTEKQVRRHRGK